MKILPCDSLRIADLVVDILRDELFDMTTKDPKRKEPKARLEAYQNHKEQGYCIVVSGYGVRNMYHRIAFYISESRDSNLVMVARGAPSGIAMSGTAMNHRAVFTSPEKAAYYIRDELVGLYELNPMGPNII